MLKRLVWLPLILALPALGCGAAAGGELVRSSVAREKSPEVAKGDLEAVVSGNSEFAFDLYQRLSDKEGNFFFSPYSISVALAMTYAGAGGETEKQMAQALRFTLPQEKLHPTFNALDLALVTRGEGAKGREGEPFRLHIANALWGQTGHKFLPGFLDTLAENYGAGMRLLDFRTNPEACRSQINEWVSGETEGKIKDLIPPGVIDSATGLVLTNAIYFDAAWEHKFKKDATSPGPFKLRDGREVTVDMMHQTASFGYAEGEGWQAVELPYDGRELSMVVLLPAEGRFDEFQNALGADRVAAIVAKLQETEVSLTLPKFKYESAFGLKDALSAMGMPDAFALGQADLSGMDGTRDLFIADVVHKALVRVDEEGTEAAAATAVIVGVTSAGPHDVIEVTVDRPFVFLIRDMETGTILFVGRVLEPTA